MDSRDGVMSVMAVMSGPFPRLRGKVGMGV